MTEKHTPTPWKFIDATKEASMQYKPIWLITSGDKQIASSSWNDNSPWFPTRSESQANAAFIVRACNSHDALVKALEDARLQLEYVQEKHGYATGETILGRIRAALAAAGAPHER